MSKLGKLFTLRTAKEPQASRMHSYAMLACWAQWMMFITINVAFTSLCGAAPRGFGLCLVPGLMVLTVLHWRKRWGCGHPTDKKDFSGVLTHMVVFALLLAMMGISSALPWN